MSYDSAVLATSPKHFWKLDETSGTAAVDSGSTPTNGVYVGSPSLNQAALSMPSGLGTLSSDPTMNLDGVDDRVTIATNPNYTALTVALWAKAPSATQDQSWFFFSQSSGSIPICVGNGFGAFGTNSKWNVGMFSGSSWFGVAGSNLVVGDERLIIATCQSNGFLRMWENGRYRGQVAVPTFAASTTTNGLYIGRRWDNGGQSSGKVGGVALWDRVLTDTEIQSIGPAESYLEQSYLESLAPNSTPWRPYGEGSGSGGGGGGGTPPTTGQLWPRGNW